MRVRTCPTHYLMSGAELLLPHSPAASVCFVWTHRDGIRGYVKLEPGSVRFRHSFSFLYLLILSRVRVTRFPKH